MSSLFKIAGLLVVMFALGNPSEAAKPIGDFINWVEVNDLDQYLSYKSYKAHNP